MRVVGDLFESELAAYGFEVCVVGMRKSRGEIHAVVRAERDRSVFRDQAFAETSQRNRELDGRAGLCAAGERKLLVDHGEDASAGRLDGYNRAIHIAEGVNGSATNNGIFTSRDVARGNVIFHERAHVDTLVIVMTATGGGGNANWFRATAACQTVVAAARARRLADLLGLRFRGGVRVDVGCPA